MWKDSQTLLMELTQFENSNWFLWNLNKIASHRWFCKRLTE
jgi:hypothetical protein